MKCSLSWYGHCCFKLEYKDISFLIDPYDTFNNIDVGIIEADYLLISSSWHDHGNIGASPQSHVLSYKGKYDFDKGFYIYGSKARESRGSSTMIYTVVFDDGFAFTNFADWGDPQGIESLNKQDIKQINKTKLGFMRINYIDLQKDYFCYDLALEICDPDIVVPIHYFPRNFIERELAPKKRNSYLKKLDIVKKMQKKLDRQYLQVASSSTELDIPCTDKLFLEFKDIHPQVCYTKQS
jgi:hypothetical protein